MKDSRRELAELGKNGVQFDGREHSAGKLPNASLRLEYMRGKELIRGEAIPYAQMIGFPLYLPNHGIRFWFQAAHPKDWDGWKLSIYRVTLIPGAGHDKLIDLWKQLSQHKLEYVREGEDVGRIEVSEENLL